MFPLLSNWIPFGRVSSGHSEWSFRLATVIFFVFELFLVSDFLRSNFWLRLLDWDAIFCLCSSISLWILSKSSSFTESALNLLYSCEFFRVRKFIISHLNIGSIYNGAFSVKLCFNDWIVIWRLLFTLSYHNEFQLKNNFSCNLEKFKPSISEKSLDLSVVENELITDDNFETSFPWILCSSVKIKIKTL